MGSSHNTWHLGQGSSGFGPHLSSGELSHFPKKQTIQTNKFLRVSNQPFEWARRIKFKEKSFTVTLLFGWVKIEFLVSKMAAESRKWTLRNLWWVLIFCLRHCISSSPYSSSLYAVHKNMQSERFAWKPTSSSVHLHGPLGFERKCKKKQMFWAKFLESDLY